MAATDTTVQQAQDALLTKLGSTPAPTQEELRALIDKYLEQVNGFYDELEQKDNAFLSQTLQAVAQLMGENVALVGQDNMQEFFDGLPLDDPMFAGLYADELAAARPAAVQPTPPAPAPVTLQSEKERIEGIAEAKRTESDVAKLTAIDALLAEASLGLEGATEIDGNAVITAAFEKAEELKADGISDAEKAEIITAATAAVPPTPPVPATLQSEKTRIEAIDEAARTESDVAKLAAIDALLADTSLGLQGTTEIDGNAVIAAAFAKAEALKADGISDAEKAEIITAATAAVPPTPPVPATLQSEKTRIEAIDEAARTESDVAKLAAIDALLADTSLGLEGTTEIDGNAVIAAAFAKAEELKADGISDAEKAEIITAATAAVPEPAPVVETHSALFDHVLGHTNGAADADKAPGFVGRGRATPDDAKRELVEFLAGRDSTLTIDTLMSDEAALDAAIRAFQTEQGVQVDGVVGPQTLAAIAEERIAKLDMDAMRDFAYGVDGRRNLVGSVDGAGRGNFDDAEVAEDNAEALANALGVEIDDDGRMSADEWKSLQAVFFGDRDGNVEADDVGVDGIAGRNTQQVIDAVVTALAEQGVTDLEHVTDDQRQAAITAGKAKAEEIER